jgi:hypothetical protein
MCFACIPSAGCMRHVANRSTSRPTSRCDSQPPHTVSREQASDVSRSSLVSSVTAQATGRQSWCRVAVAGITHRRTHSERLVFGEATSTYNCDSATEMWRFGLRAWLAEAGAAELNQRNILLGRGSGQGTFAGDHCYDHQAGQLHILALPLL